MTSHDHLTKAMIEAICDQDAAIQKAEFALDFAEAATEAGNIARSMTFKRQAELYRKEAQRFADLYETLERLSKKEGRSAA